MEAPSAAARAPAAGRVTGIDEEDSSEHAHTARAKALQLHRGYVGPFFINLNIAAPSGPAANLPRNLGGGRLLEVNWYSTARAALGVNSRRPSCTFSAIDDAIRCSRRIVADATSRFCPLVEDDAEHFPDVRSCSSKECEARAPSRRGRGSVLDDATSLSNSFKSWC
jgi:hypothetical protein